MRIKRSLLEQIINEELTRYMEQQIFEAAPGIGSPLDDDMPPPDDVPPGEGPVGPPETDATAAEGEDPMDAEIDSALAGEEGPGDGSIASDMMGKTIENISLEHESDAVPGASELVIGFQGEEDKLRVILMPTGNFKFFWKGLKSDIGSTEDVPPEELEAETDADSELEGDELDLESEPLPTDDGGMEDPELPEV